MKNIHFSPLPLLVLVVGLFGAAGCSRLLPPRTATAHSFQMALDTRRLPVETLSGCFIPAVFPAITRIPVVMAQKVPAGAVYKSASVEVTSKNGEMKVLEAVIEDNQVYLKFAVPDVDSFTQYNVLVRTEYEYR